jgi:hypothetical protein
VSKQLLTLQTFERFLSHTRSKMTFEMMQFITIVSFFHDCFFLSPQLMTFAPLSFAKMPLRRQIVRRGKQPQLWVCDDAPRLLMSSSSSPRGRLRYQNARNPVTLKCCRDMTIFKSKFKELSRAANKWLRLSAERERITLIGHNQGDHQIRRRRG